MLYITSLNKLSDNPTCRIMVETKQDFIRLCELLKIKPDKQHNDNGVYWAEINKEQRDITNNFRQVTHCRDGNGVGEFDYYKEDMKRSK